ncbi:MAG: hypothetical protein CVU50_10185, partial [Candidatus Cloacimonetes bacterium HGW-Cloacimonetes-3]
LSILSIVLLVTTFNGLGCILKRVTLQNPAIGDVPLEVNFINQSVTVISSCLWEFGDGTTSTLLNPNHTFTLEGVYNVKLTVWDEYFNTNITHQVRVIAHPMLDTAQLTGNVFAKTYLNEHSTIFDVDIQSSGTDTLFVSNLYWKSQQRDSYFEYTFSHLNEVIIPGAATNIQVQFTPLTEGIFADTLCVVNNSENHPLLMIPFSGRGYKLYAAFTAIPLSGDVPLTVAFTDASTEDIIQWNWDFADGNTSTQPNPTHLFQIEGVYPVVLTVSDGIHFDAVTHNINVIAHPIVVCNDSLIVDLGDLYLGETSDVITLTIHSTGTDTLYVNNIRWKYSRPGFHYSSDAYHIPILPGSSTTVNIWFQPTVQGAFTDSLFIETNAENTPVIKVKVNGRGEIVPPKPPDNVHIVMNGTNAVLSWDAVALTIFDTPIAPDYYFVFNSSSPHGEFAFNGATSGLQYTQFMVGAFQPMMFYKVIAYKYYGRGVFDFGTLGLVQGMPEAEVLKLLHLQ